MYTYVYLFIFLLFIFFFLFSCTFLFLRGSFSLYFVYLQLLYSIFSCFFFSFFFENSFKNCLHDFTSSSQKLCFRVRESLFSLTCVSQKSYLVTLFSIHYFLVLLLLFCSFHTKYISNDERFR